MLNLFDGNRYTDTANTIDREIYYTLYKLMKDWAKEGYSVREMGAIAHSAVQDAICTVILDTRAKEKETERD